MDWEDIVKHAEGCLDKRISSISSALKSNQAQVSKLISTCETLEKHFKLSLNKLPKPHLSPSHAQTERAIGSRLKSPSTLKHPTDIHKKPAAHEDPKLKHSESKAEEELKKQESRTSIKKSVDFAENKTKIPPEHKKTISSKHEDLKKQSKPDEDCKNDLKHVESKKTIPRPSEKTPKKNEENADKGKKDAKTEKKTETKPKTQEVSDEGEVVNDENYICLTPKPKVYDETLIKLKLDQIKDESFNKKAENYSVSTGVQILIHSLSKFTSEKFYLTKDNPPAQFLWLFKVVLLLLNKEFDEENLWKSVKDLLTGGNGSRIMKNFGSFLINACNEMDFSEENLEKVEKSVIGVDVDCKKFGKDCQVSGILCYLVKEALLFAGINMEDGPNWRLKRRWEYKLAHLDS